MLKWRWLLMFAVLASIVLSACAAADAGTPPVDESSEETLVIEPTDPFEKGDSPELESPLPGPGSPLPTPGTIESPGVARDLRMKVAETLDVSPDLLTALSILSVTWRDASLGCPEPGMMYAQVLTDGWLAVYEDPDGRQIEVHATQNLGSFVICENGAEEPAERPVTSEDNPAVQAAVAALAEKLGVDAETITVQRVELEEWSDSCLGCGGIAESCLTVITPGYRVMLEYEGDVYEMRTDRVGRSIRLCERGGA